MKLPKLFNRKRPQNATRLEVTSSQGAISRFTGDAWNIDVAQSGIDAIARMMGKLELRPMMRFADGSEVPCDARLARLLSVEPNPLMSSYQLMYTLTVHLFLHGNAWCLISRDAQGHVDGLWPLHVASAEMLQGPNGEPVMGFTYKNGTTDYIRYSDLVHLRRHLNGSDLLGDSPDALRPGLELASAQDRALEKEIRSSGVVMGIIRMKQLLSEDELNKKAESFKKNYLSPESGIGVVAVSDAEEFVPLKPEVVSINGEDMAATRDKILSFYGLSQSIVDGTADENQMQAFIESTIEPLALELSLEMSRKIYAGSHTRRIDVSLERLGFVSTANKVRIIEEAAPMGILSVNEARRLLGLPPLAEDRTVQSLNFANVDLVDKYQIAKASTNGKITSLLEGMEDE